MRGGAVSDFIQVERHGAIQILRLNRPDKKNALTKDMYAALAHHLADGEDDESVGVHVLCGAGTDFSAGNDLQDFLSMEDIVDTPAESFITQVAALTKPMVAAVKGVAVGVGSTVLLHCDLVVAAEDTRFQFPFVNLGLVPEAGSSLLLPRLAGHQRAAELLMLGEPFSASTAQAIGLVNAVVPAGQEDETAMDFAHRLSERPRNALRNTKALLKRPDETVAERMRVEALLFGEALKSPELQEAIAAFYGRKNKA